MRKINVLILLSMTLFTLILSPSNSSSVNIEITHNVIHTATDTTPLNVNPSILTDMGLNDIISEGYKGDDINVAIIDTGINPDYFDNIRMNVNYISGESNEDNLGHGTQVASLIAGDNFGSNQYDGIAQNVDLYIFKILGGDEGETTTDIVISAFNYIISMQQDSDPLNDIDIVNLSFGSVGTDTELVDAVIDLWNNGVVVVCAGGNEGLYSDDSTGESYYPVYYTVNSPGLALNAISVGALKTPTEVAQFSSVGPSEDMLLKPDLVAPGQSIMVMDNNGDASTGSGTSYSSPIIVGGISCVLSKLISNGYERPSPDEIKMALLDSCESIGADMYAEGNGVPNFQIMYDILVSYQELTTNKLVAVYPDNLVFPNKFDYELETEYADTYYAFSEVEFSNFKTTLIVRKNLIEPVQIIVDTSIASFLRVYCEDSIQIAGQYILNVDYISGLNFPGEFEGDINLIITNGETDIISDAIHVKITLSFLGLFRTLWNNWWGKIFLIFLPSLLGVGIVVKKKTSKNKNMTYDPTDPTQPLKVCPNGYECIYDMETKSFKIIKKFEILK